MSIAATELVIGAIRGRWISIKYRVGSLRYFGFDISGKLVRKKTNNIGIKTKSLTKERTKTSVVRASGIFEPNVQPQ